MNILFTTPAYPPFPGGGERYVCSLAKGLVRRGHCVTIVTSAGKTEADFWQGVEQKVVEETAHAKSGYADHLRVVRCPIRPMPGGRLGVLGWRKLMVLTSMLPGSQTAVLSRMARQIPPIQKLLPTMEGLNGRFDLVHGFNISWEHALLAGWQFARQKNIPFIVTPFAHLGSPGHERVALNSTMDHQRHILSDADRVLTLTDIETNGLKQHGVSSPQMAAIGAGLDTVPPVENVQAVLNKHHITRDFVLFIGRANVDKGAIDGAKAVLKLQKMENAPLFVLIGQSSPAFKRFYAGLGEKEREVIRPLHILSENEKHALLAACNQLILPSRSDSFGIVFLEAWAHAKPVIGANAGGIPGVVDDGKNGILVPYGDIQGLADAMKKLLTDNALNRKMGLHGKAKLATHFTWERVTERVIEHYHLVTSEQ